MILLIRKRNRKGCPDKKHLNSIMILLIPIAKIAFEGGL